MRIEDVILGRENVIMERDSVRILSLVTLAIIFIILFLYFLQLILK